MANEVTDKVEEQRKILIKLAIAYRVCDEKDKKKFEDKMEEKEKYMRDIFSKIHDL